MKYIVQLKIDALDSTPLKERILKEAYLKEKDLLGFQILKKSIDARKKQSIFILYRVLIEATQKPKCTYEAYIEKEKRETYKIQKNDKKILVVGAGPSGLFCCYELAKAGMNVTLVERGKGVLDRIQDIELFRSKGIFQNNSNVSYGAGGAGTFSDGKLSTGIKNKDIHYVLETFYSFGANEDILYDSKPHIGTDKLIEVISNFTKELEKLKVNVQFDTELIDIKNHYAVLKTGQSESKEYFDDIVLAIGHSCYDTFSMLYRNKLYLEPKPFSIGVRIEHLQKTIDLIQYGPKYENAPSLGSADYKMVAHVDSTRTLYTFCMCPGGEVVISSACEGQMVVNGMSYQARNLPNANSALLVNVEVNDYYHDSPLDGFSFIEDIEKKAFQVSNSMKAPIQTLGSFLYQKPNVIRSVIPSVKPGYVLCDLHDILPEFVSKTIEKGILMFDQQMVGFNQEDAILTGVETHSSSPVRIPRNEYLVSNIDYIYPCGEGAGYAGGITSACCDGIKVAKAILEKYNEK